MSKDQCLVAVTLTDAEVIERTYRARKKVEDEEKARMMHKIKKIKMGGLN